ncbi:MAG: hypothetical protein KBG11_11395 [Bacteroidia bacterium]|nr:hypothetical protein [Bacteroidia bacterium]
MKILHISANFLAKKSILWLLTVTLVLFIGVTSVRFNRNTTLVNRPLNDARYFIAYVEYFRGDVPSDVIRPASNWRLLVPLVASVLPLSPLSAINVTNQLLLLLSLVILYQSMLLVGINKGYVWLGLMLFILSFPTFYYTTIGYIDPGVMFFVSICIYAVLAQKVAMLILGFTIGFLAKEAIVVVIPFAVVYQFMQGKPKKAIGLAILLTVLYVALSYLVRQYAYITPGEKNNLFWVANSSNILLNINRINSLLAPILSLGLVGFLYALSIKYQTIIKSPLQLATLALVVTAIAMYAFAFITTFADGRPFWLAYYPMIIVGMIWLQEQQQVQKN